MLQVVGRFGPVDVLVNNAGVIEVGPAETMTLGDYEEAMAVNFWGVVYPTLAVLPAMRERGRGRIVNITSIGGRLGVPHLVPYSASKFAALGFSQGLRAEERRHGVVVTSVVPGPDADGKPAQRDVPGTAPRGVRLVQHRRQSSRPHHRRGRGGPPDPRRRATRRRGGALPAGHPARRHRGRGRAEPDGIGLELASRLLPDAPAGRRGRRPGRESQSAASPSWLTRLGDKAARRYNQIAPSEGSSV